MLLITDRVLERDLCMNFVYADCVMISTNQKAYFKRSAVFLKITKVVLHESSDLLVNMISTEHDQLWADIRSSMR